MPPFQVAGQDSSFPDVGTLSLDPGSSNGITFEVSVSVPISLLQKLQQRVPEDGIHANALARVVATDIVACEALFEQSFFDGAATIEITIRGIARRVSSTLAS